MASFWNNIMGAFLSEVPKTEKKKRNPMANEDMDEFIKKRYPGVVDQPTLLGLRKLYQDQWLREKGIREKQEEARRGQWGVNYHKGNRPGIGEYAMPYKYYEPPKHQDQERYRGFYLQQPPKYVPEGTQGMPSRPYPNITITPGVRG